jgi:hypothetical protein
MKSVFLIGAAILVAFKIGEQNARLGQLDFFLTKTVDVQGIQETQYLFIDGVGMIGYDSDPNNATILSYWDAMTIRGLLKKMAPGNDLKLETVSELILVS